MERKEAVALIGKAVRYAPAGVSDFAQRVLTEYGVITSVNDEVAFVQYTGEMHSKATYFYDLYAVPFYDLHAVPDETGSVM